MTGPQTLAATELYRSCDDAVLGFETTAELQPLDRLLGQERALEAIEFGVDIKRQGFHVYALGSPGVGKHELVRSILSSRAAEGGARYDWCYVNNFANPQQPRLLKLEAGVGARLSKDMLQFVEDLLTSLPSTFQSEEYRNRRQEIEDEMSERYEHAFSKLDTEAKARNIALLRTPSGYTMAPMIDGNIVGPEEFAKLPPAQQEKIEHDVAELQQQLQDVIRQLPLLKREGSHRIRELNKEITRLTVEQFLATLVQKYQGQDSVQEYLSAVKNHAIENVEDFLPKDGNPDLEHLKQRAQAFTPYRVNVIVDSTDTTGAPVVYEDNPTYANLVGRVEYLAEMGNLLTDFTLIKAGALHRANGGYLILEAWKLLSHIYAWEGLKRALNSGEVKIASLQEVLSLTSTLSLEPECAPLDVKVVLIGEPLLYYLLDHYDPEFGQLFSVAADFSGDTDRSVESQQLFARLVATLQQRNELLPLDRQAVGRVIEHASRLAEDSAKLSLQVDNLCRLLQEAEHWAQKDGGSRIGRAHIEQAIASQRRRRDRVRERIQEQITREIKLIDTEGSKVAQVNGLTVMALGDYMFGSPARITATARLGAGKVVDIERESKLGGDIHSKAVLIISAYLADRYARERPLPLAASLVFEQSYGGVEGDSASCAEVCVLLSAIAGIPLRQDLAVTGSMNQLGQVQAIGGVNEKIEGFFEICAARGLTGSQGVIIPVANQVHLMLREDVRQAVAEGRFHIYTAAHVEDVMQLLSGLEPGAADARGVWPEGTFNRRVSDRIEQLQKLHKQFAGGDDKEKEGKANGS